MITSHTLTETAIMEKILAGPSADVFHKGICLQGEGDVAYYDDQMPLKMRSYCVVYIRWIFISQIFLK